MAGISPTNGATSNLPINSLVTKTGPAATPSSADSVTGQLGADAFLKLLTTQLSNQDPLQPMDDTQSVSQLAQFSALQASTNLSDAFSKFQSNFAVLQSASLIGKNVTVSVADAAGNSSSVSGTVANIQVINGSPTFTMKDSSGHIINDTNGKPLTFGTSQITGLN